MGESRERTDWFGNKYTENYDSSGKKIGESHARSDWFGNEYTEHTDSSGKKTGQSDSRSDWFGNEYTEHSDSSGKKTGESHARKDWFGNDYTEHSGSGWHGSTSSNSSSGSKSSSKSSGFGVGSGGGGGGGVSSGGSVSGGFGGVSGGYTGSGSGVIKFLIGAFGVLLFLYLWNASSNTVPSTLPQSSQQVDNKPVQSVPMTRGVDISHSEILPSGSRVEVFAVENGVETRQLPVDSWSQINGMVHINLKEDVPQNMPVNVKWFPLVTPQITRSIDVSHSEILPSGSRVEVYAVENGIETRQLPVDSWTQINGMVHINLKEDVPQNMPVNVKWFPLVTSQMTHSIDVEYPNIIPPGSRIEVWEMDGGVEIRPLQLSSCNQANGKLHIILSEDVPQDIQVIIKVVPEFRRVMLPPLDEPMPWRHRRPRRY